MKAKKRITLKSNVRLRAYNVIADAVEGACDGGVARAFKHTDKPDRSEIAAACTQYVMVALCELIDFGIE
jgi:hypothetical protein